MMNQEWPVYKTNISKLNDIFSAFQADYADTFRHYARDKATSEEALLYKSFKEIYQESLGHTDDEFVHPKFMQQFLGAGIIPSFKTTGELRADSKNAVSSPSRIGKSLSVFHHVMRNAGKEWGLYFDVSKLSEDFQAILEWLDKPADNSRPMIYKDKNDTFIVDDIVRRFSELPAVPIRIPQKYAGKDAQSDVITEFANKPIPFSRTHYGEADSYTETYEIPTAALAWAIRPAGMSIQGRPDESPMKPFLEKVVGIGKDAGKKMLDLHHAAPEVFDNYDRDAMATALYDQRAWIKTAEAVEKIRGNKGEGYEKALHLIGDSGKRVNVLSAYKVAVILYAITERMEKLAADTNKSPALQEIVNSDYNTFSFNELTQKLKDLSIKLYDNGIATEEQLSVIKRDDIHQLDPENFYKENLEEIALEQKERLRAFFAQHQQYCDVVTAFFEVIPKLEKALPVKDSLPRNAEYIAEFCEHHMITRFGQKEAIVPHHQRKHHIVRGLE